MKIRVFDTYQRCQVSLRLLITKVTCLKTSDGLTNLIVLTVYIFSNVQSDGVTDRVEIHPEIFQVYIKGTFQLSINQSINQAIN